MARYILKRLVISLLTIWAIATISFFLMRLLPGNPFIVANPLDMTNAQKMMERLGNPSRFGYPVFVVLNAQGDVIHTQDSSFLEEGKGYNKEKVLRFFKCWTPEAVKL